MHRQYMDGDKSTNVFAFRKKIEVVFGLQIWQRIEHYTADPPTSK